MLRSGPDRVGIFDRVHHPSLEHEDVTRPQAAVMTHHQRMSARMATSNFE
jgi:hypothetical protein